MKRAIFFLPLRSLTGIASQALAGVIPTNSARVQFCSRRGETISLTVDQKGTILERFFDPSPKKIVQIAEPTLSVLIVPERSDQDSKPTQSAVMAHWLEPLKDFDDFLAVTVDSLTGLCQRNLFFYIIEHHNKIFKKYFLVLADIGGFSRLSHWAPVSDTQRLIILMKNIFEETIGPEQLVLLARYGNDKMALLIDPRGKPVEIIMEEALDHFRIKSYKIFNLPLSFRWASVSCEGRENAEGLIEMAEQALREQKKEKKKMPILDKPTRLLCLLDGDANNPLDGIARADAELSRRIRDRCFPEIPLEIINGLAAKKDESLQVLPGDLVIAGGATAGFLASKTDPLALLLSVHTPGSPAKVRIPEVTHSYGVQSGVENDSARLKYQRMQKALSRCDLLMVNSQWTADILWRTYFPQFPGVFPPVVAECIGLQRDNVEAVFPRPPSSLNRPILLSVVRNSPRKRVEGLFHAAKILRQTWDVQPEWHVLCGNDRDAVVDQGREAGVQGFIFHEFLESKIKQELFAKAHLFVHAAHCEHLGLSLLEALSMGLPAVASRSGGPPTYLVNEKEVLFFDPDHWEDLAKQIFRLLSEPSLAMTLSQAGPLLVRSRFTWDRVLDRIEPVLSRLLKYPVPHS